MDSTRKYTRQFISKSIVRFERVPPTNYYVIQSWKDIQNIIQNLILVCYLDTKDIIWSILVRQAGKNAGLIAF